LLSLAISLAAWPLAAQTPAQIPFQITVDQNAIMRQAALTRPKSLGGVVSAPIAGICAERLGETRFRLTAPRSKARRAEPSPSPGGKD
jgi:hypothetical protein